MVGGRASQGSPIQGLSDNSSWQWLFYPLPRPLPQQARGGVTRGADMGCVGGRPYRSPLQFGIGWREGGPRVAPTDWWWLAGGRPLGRPYGLVVAGGRASQGSPLRIGIGGRAGDSQSRPYGLVEVGGWATHRVAPTVWWWREGERRVAPTIWYWRAGGRLDRSPLRMVLAGGRAKGRWYSLVLAGGRAKGRPYGLVVIEIVVWSVSSASKRTRYHLRGGYEDAR